MDSDVLLNARIYTDFQGLNKLKHIDNPDKMKKEVAQQFEAILMQMVLTSMRNASKAMSSDLFGCQQMDFYQDLYDKQLTLLLSNTENGFAKMVEKNIDQMQPKLPQSEDNKVAENYTKSLQQQDRVFRKPNAVSKNYELTPISPKTAEPEVFKSQEDFVHKLWPSAQYAANLLGVGPDLLLAQAALETNWGKNIISQYNTSTHSLFNIKADETWQKKTATVDSLEERNGILVKEKSQFRSYETFKDSFLDYVDLIKQNKRYSESLSKVDNPKEYLQSLQRAGYATDSNYADKILNIFSSKVFRNLVKKVKSTT